MRIDNYPKAKTLQELLAWAKFSQTDLSKILGVSTRSLRRWSASGIVPRADAVLTIARTLCVPLSVVYEALGFDVSGIPLEYTEQDLLVDQASTPVDPELQTLISQFAAYLQKKTSQHNN